MSTKDDLIAAKALIDTPEKYRAFCEEYAQGIPSAIRQATSGSTERRIKAMIILKDARRPQSAPKHVEIMRTFDRAIAAAGDTP